MGLFKKHPYKRCGDGAVTDISSAQEFWQENEWNTFKPMKGKFSFGQSSFSAPVCPYTAFGTTLLLLLSWRLLPAM